MVALPLSLGGALIGLMIAQKALGLYALIGIVLLMGIVTKNSILLVDYTLINQEEGKSQYQALIERWGVSLATDFDDFPCHDCGDSFP
jgi:multidrug efflux pump subunit AcrB